MRQVYKIGINKEASIRLSAYSIVLFFLAASIISHITGHSSYNSGNTLLMLLSFVAMIMVHELVHGFFFWLFGGKPKFGVGIQYILPYAYATSPGQPYSFWQMAIIGLSPFFLLSVASAALGVLAPSLVAYAAVAFIGNFAGAVGDLWLMHKVWKFRGIKSTQFVDLKDGLAVHSGDAKAKAVASRLVNRAEPSKFINTWLKACFVLGLVVILVTVVLSLLNVNRPIIIGVEAFYLIKYTPFSNGRLEVGLNLLPILAAGFTFTLLLRILDKKSGIPK